MTRRARRAGALATEVEDLVTGYGVPLLTTAVRVLLADRERPATAEHLARLAATERAEFLRTRVPPRLCSAIGPDGAATRPRWWADGRWRLQRRIATDDARVLWQGRFVERTCSDLLARRRPASPELAELLRGTVALLGLGEELARMPDPSDWEEIRALVLDDLPGVMFADDVATDTQAAAERSILAAERPAADLYFGTPRT
jgi:hypothetical protein